MRCEICIGRAFLLMAAIAFPISIQAGITNPDLSAIGQIFGGYTDEVGNPDSEEPTLKLGEAEIVLDAYLNPYFKGLLNISGGEDGLALEEAYTSMVKGLPWGLGLKAGKYRLGFGKINPSHPHSYPFMDPPRSLAALLPGEDGFNEAGIQVSDLLPTVGDWASTLSADVIEGKQFHPGQDWTRLGYLGRWSNDFLLGESGALETGLSAATGKDISRERESAYIWGADVKAKFYLLGASQLTVQGEGILNLGHFNDSTNAVNPGIKQRNRSGFVALADYRYHTRYNGGAFFEQWENVDFPSTTDRALRGFLGYAVLEESTLLRLAYEYFMPEIGDPVNTVTLQLLFSMGPHKAHQF